jgi:hypothetical protein
MDDVWIALTAYPVESWHTNEHASILRRVLPFLINGFCRGPALPELIERVIDECGCARYSGVQ